MEHKLNIYNTLTRKNELFVPLHEPFVGMYVCGPTVYGDPHLGHARPALTFDVLYRYLMHLGYRVRYVRNITDVGHLENDADEGEDKIAKKARVEHLEPMEIVQYYTNRYHHFIDKLNILRPNIEPHASGHIPEQIEMIEKIIENGFAYEANGSVYFDVKKYSETFHYGKLSGRVLEDLYSTTRELDGQQEKRNSFDFALWKKAAPEHIMRWHSKWSDGFPGWHLERSVMGAKYLGEVFDIHGGGMDLLFPHHECEIAQSVATNGKEAVRYWIHNNMLTINGQKMSKSLGNFITLEQLFLGKHAMLVQAYSPMTLKFFLLQAHYRGTIDFSNEALQAAEKGLVRLFNALKTLQKLVAGEKSSVAIPHLLAKCYDALNDDLNTPILISHLFDGVKTINLIAEGKETIDEQELTMLKKLFNDFVTEILGLTDETASSANDEVLKQIVDLLLNVRIDAKNRKDFATSDKIRNELIKIGFEIKDRKDGFEWELKI